MKPQLKADLTAGLMILVIFLGVLILMSIAAR